MAQRASRSTSRNATTRSVSPLDDWLNQKFQTFADEIRSTLVDEVSKKVTAAIAEELAARLSVVAAAEPEQHKPTNEKFLDIRRVTEETGVSKSTVLRMVKNGRDPGKAAAKLRDAGCKVEKPESLGNNGWRVRVNGVLLTGAEVIDLAEGDDLDQLLRIVARIGSCKDPDASLRFGGRITERRRELLRSLRMTESDTEGIPTARLQLVWVLARGTDKDKRTPTFPPPVDISGNRIGWPAAAVKSWIAARGAQ